MRDVLKASTTYAMLALLACTGISLHAQTPEVSTSAVRVSPSDSHVSETDFVVKTYRVTNMTQQNEANEIVVALRNILSPSDRIYMDFAANTIVLAAPADQQQTAQTLLAKLDFVKPTYRITYTLTETAGGKRIGTQHYTLTAADGQRVTLKQGSKIPLLTGAAGSAPQFQYIDVGMNFSVEADAAGDGVLLKNKVEQSSVGEEKAISGVQEPIIRQAVLEGSSFLQFGKPLILGSLDVVGSTHRIEVEAVAETIKQGASAH